MRTGKREINLAKEASGEEEERNEAEDEGRGEQWRVYCPKFQEIKKMRDQTRYRCKLR